MQRHYNILATLLLVLTTAVAMVSCADDAEMRTDENLLPIAFSSIEAEQESETRGGTNLGHDFVVYGNKFVDGEMQTVFDGYNVKYHAGTANTTNDNTHDYYYAEGEQTVKYWDLSAREYHFWALWAENPSLAGLTGENHEVLTIPNVPLQVGEPAPADHVLYSSLVVRHPVSPEVVQLEFKRPYAKVRIMFYTEEAIESEQDNIELSNITFSPNAEAQSPLVNKVYGQGDVIVTYPLPSDNCEGRAQEKVTVENLRQPQGELAFDAVTLTPGLGVSASNAVSAPIDESEGLRLDDMPGSSLKAKRRKAGEIAGKKYFYYLLPMGEKNPDFTLQLRINDDSTLKTAAVPAAFMQWKPNVLYTYIFKISGVSKFKISGVSKKVELYDVKIDPWQYGGSKEE